MSEPTPPGSATGPVDVDEHVRQTVAWHFDPRTGSPYWLAKAKELDFDPLRDVRTVADLGRFPDLGDELRTVRADELIPRGAETDLFEVFESGGTLGAPKRVVDAISRTRCVDWCSEVLDAHGFPSRGNWLHVGPSGPHVVGRSIRRLASLRRSLCFTVDMDPRWVRKVLQQGRDELAAEYVEHVLDQIELIVASQDIRVLFITPAMLEAVYARPSLYEPLAAQLEGLLWAGTAASPETLKLIETVLFPRAAVSGWYGNTLMGIAPQRPKEDGDEHRCVFRPFHPASIVQLVHPETRAPVGYGERGQVIMHLLTRDMFLPN